MSRGKLLIRPGTRGFGLYRLGAAAASGHRGLYWADITLTEPYHPHHFQRLTDETDVTDPGQMAYQAGNSWLRPKPVGSLRSHRATQALPGRHHIN